MSQVRALSIILLALCSACKAPSSWMRPSRTSSSSFTESAQSATDSQVLSTTEKAAQPIDHSVDQQPLETALADTLNGTQAIADNAASHVETSVQPLEQPAPLVIDLSQSALSKPSLNGSEIMPTSVQVDTANSKTDTNVGLVASSSVSTVEPTVHLTITGVRPERGPVKIALYTNEQTFAALKDSSQSIQLPSDQSTLEKTLPMSGRFAVAVYQDINGDGKLNRNRFGIPTEPFAFSNNAVGVRGPPSFEQAAVVVPEKRDVPLPVPIQLP